MNSSDDELFDHNDYDDDDNYYFGGHQYHYRDRRNQNHFVKVQQDVAAEETKLIEPEDEEKLFHKVSCYLKAPFTILGICTLQKLAFLPSTIPAYRLEQLAKIICKNIFNPVLSGDDYISEYTDFCKGFAYLKASAMQGGIVAFEQILISAFLDELPKRFDYEKKLEKLTENRDIPEEKKQKWLHYQKEEQKKMLKRTTCRSIKFLTNLFYLYPEIVYRVLEFLLKSQEEEAFHYLCFLIDEIQNLDTVVGVRDEVKLTNIQAMKTFYWDKKRDDDFGRIRLQRPLPVENKVLTPLFENIIKMAQDNYTSFYMRDALQGIINDNPQKENPPQDFIKYWIKDCLRVSRCSYYNDFNIENTEKYGYRIWTLRCKNLCEYGWEGFRSLEHVEFGGIKTKIMTQKEVAKGKDSENMY